MNASPVTAKESPRDPSIAVAPPPARPAAAGPTLHSTGSAAVALQRDRGPGNITPYVNSAARGDKLFKDHPLSGTHVLKSGVVVPTPYHAYDADAVFIMGSADLATARRLMGDKSFLQHVTIDGNRAVVSLLVANYRDTSLGPYREFVLASQLANEQIDISSKNPWALARPLFDEAGTGHVLQLALNREAVVPIDYGREILGLDKIPSQAVVERSGHTLRFDFRSPSGDARMIGGQVTTDTSWWTRLKASFGMLRGIGLRKTMKFLWTRTLAWNLVSVDPAGGGLVRSRSLSKGIPITNLWNKNDVLDFGDTPLGRTLRALDFKPLLTSHYAHGKIVLEATKAIR